MLLLVPSTLKWSRLEGSEKPPASPFSTQTPDRAVPHSFFFQPSCCRIPFPRPGATGREAETPRWTEGVTAALFPSVLDRTHNRLPYPASHPKISPCLFKILLHLGPWLLRPWTVHCTWSCKSVPCACMHTGALQQQKAAAQRDNGRASAEPHDARAERADERGEARNVRAHANHTLTKNSRIQRVNRITRIK